MSIGGGDALQHNVNLIMSNINWPHNCVGCGTDRNVTVHPTTHTLIKSYLKEATRQEDGYYKEQSMNVETKFYLCPACKTKAVESIKKAKEADAAKWGKVALITVGIIWLVFTGLAVFMFFRYNHWLRYLCFWPTLIIGILWIVNFVKGVILGKYDPDLSQSPDTYYYNFLLKHTFGDDSMTICGKFGKVPKMQVFKLHNDKFREIYNRKNPELYAS